MQDETLSQPLPLPQPRPRRSNLATLLVALVAFAFGGVAVGALVHAGRLPYALPELGTRKAVEARLARGAQPATPAAPASPALAEPAALAPLEGRLAMLEDRLSRIDGEANAASGNAARAEALLIAFAARRRIEQGEPLGYIEQQLKLRFSDAQPKAVQTLISAARTPVTLDELYSQLEAAAPVLAGTVRDESTWTRVRREIASLFVVRRAPVPSATPQDRIARARLMLASGKIDEAIAEVERLPGADEVQGWIEAARRYEEAQRALDVIETSAMLEPKALHDSAGRPIEQGSPLAPTADATPTD